VSGRFGWAICFSAGLFAAQDASVASLEGFSETVERLVHQSSPAVVQIVADGFGTRDDETSGHTSTVSRQKGIGTGVVLSADGDVITNAHVVSGARRVRVRAGARSIDAQVVGIDRDTDLALLRVPGTEWPHLRLADSSMARQGQIVIALGSPRGLENSVSMGVISSAARQISPDAAIAFIQTDAPINPGNSGGPLISPRGEVVGINTFIITESGGSEGLGFAIPSNLVRDVYAQLKKYGRVRRGELGVVIRSVTPALVKALGLTRDQGILIQDVVPGKAAAEAGLKADDIVTRVEGRPVRNIRQFSNNLFRSEIGGTLTLEIVRGGSEAQMIQVPFQEAVDATEKIAQQVRDQAVPIPQLGSWA
jgi:serine protease Do